MNLPLNWLKEFVKINASATEIAEKLTLSGSETEKIVQHGKSLKNIVVGSIKEIKPHPDADKLRLAYVDVGKKDMLTIVCGAPNITAGQKVPVVLLGGEVPGMKIEARKIRGVASQGMLASERELGIGDDHGGIFILPDESTVGSDVIKLLELDDQVLELDITPNRPDCFSILGLAREVAALYGLKIQDTRNKKQIRCKKQETNKTASSVLRVTIQDKKLCPRYTGRVVENVKVGPSPLWIQNRLRQAGIRPINNAVDVTNYVMIELGQPMHAFDAALLYTKGRQDEHERKQIIVRSAKKGEKIDALDEKTYQLEPGMCVIADEKGPIAIGGIMGGTGSGVTEKTTTVILEAATFDPVSVRKTGRALGIKSDAGARHEKGIDRSAIEQASERAAGLLAEISKGAVLKGAVVVGQAHKKPPAITLPFAEIERLLGVPVSAAKAKAILSSLGFGVAGSAKQLSVSVPPWRVWDICQAADLIEEIGRILDYNTIPKTLPPSAAGSPKQDARLLLRRALRQYLAGAGYTELLTYSFYSEQAAELSRVANRDHVKLTNPVSKDYPYMRASLLPWMLDKLSQNSAQLSREQFRLFETGNVFHAKEGEREQAAIGLIDTSAFFETLYRTLRGVLEQFVGEPSIVEERDCEYLISYHHKRVASIRLFEKGSVPAMRFRSQSAVLLIDLGQLLSVMRAKRVVFKPIPYYPLIERDLGVIVPSVVQYKKVQQCISGFDPLIKDVALFDVYHGLSEGASYAMRITFGSTDRTLEAREVDEIVEKLKKKLAKTLDVSFR